MFAANALLEFPNHRNESGDGTTRYHILFVLIRYHGHLRGLAHHGIDSPCIMLSCLSTDLEERSAMDYFISFPTFTYPRAKRPGLALWSPPIGGAVRGVRISQNRCCDFGGCL